MKKGEAYQEQAAVLEANVGWSSTEGSSPRSGAECSSWRSVEVS